MQTMRTANPLTPWEHTSAKPSGDITDWQTHDFPDKSKWVLAYMDLFGPFGQAAHAERAARLSAYGWTPEDLRAVCAAPHRVTSLHSPETTTEAQAEALAALTDEVTAFALLSVAASAHRRQGYAAHLSEEYRWGPEEVLAVIGTDAGGGEPFQAVAKHMRADLLPLIMGPGPVTETLRHSLDARNRTDWLTPKTPERGSRERGRNERG